MRASSTPERFRTALDPGTVVADQAHLLLAVDNGELVISGGTRGRKHILTIGRDDHHVRRIVIIGHTGYLSTDVMEWIYDTCSPSGRRTSPQPVAFLSVDHEGSVLLSSTATPYFRELMHAQAAVRGTPAGLDITRYLLREKFSGHGRALLEWDADGWLAELEKKATRQELRNLREQEEEQYFAAWRHFSVRLGGATPTHQPPFTRRSSDAMQASARNGTPDPINALLDHCYADALVESVLACHIAGLAPHFGIDHTESPTRSMALDLMEAIRPEVEAYVLDLVGNRTFRRKDFVPVREGTPPVHGPLARELGNQRATWHRAIAEHAERVRRTIDATFAGKTS